MNVLTKCFLGVGSPLAGFYVSILPQVEAWLRVVSLLVGISVGVATLLSLLRRK